MVFVVECSLKHWHSAKGWLFRLLLGCLFTVSLGSLFTAGNVCLLPGLQHDIARDVVKMAVKESLKSKAAARKQGQLQVGVEGGSLRGWALIFPVTFVLIKHRRSFAWLFWGERAHTMMQVFSCTPMPGNG